MAEDWTPLDEMAGALSDLLDWYERQTFEAAEGRDGGGEDSGLSAVVGRARAALNAYPGTCADTEALAAFVGVPWPSPAPSSEAQP